MHPFKSSNKSNNSRKAATYIQKKQSNPQKIQKYISTHYVLEVLMNVMKWKQEMTVYGGNSHNPKISAQWQTYIKPTLHWISWACYPIERTSFPFWCHLHVMGQLCFLSLGWVGVASMKQRQCSFWGYHIWDDFSFSHFYDWWTSLHQHSR